MLFCSSEHFYNYGEKKLCDKIFYQPNARPVLSHPFSSDSEFSSFELEPKFVLLLPGSSPSRPSAGGHPLLFFLPVFNVAATSPLPYHSVLR